jgi:hypothetical protein
MSSELKPGGGVRSSRTHRLENRCHRERMGLRGSAALPRTGGTPMLPLGGEDRARERRTGPGDGPARFRARSTGGEAGEKKNLLYFLGIRGMVLEVGPPSQAETWYSYRKTLI